MQAAAQCRTRGGLGQRLPRFPRLIPPGFMNSSGRAPDQPRAAARTGLAPAAQPRAPGAVQARVPPPRVAHAVARAAESTGIILV